MCAFVCVTFSCHQTDYNNTLLPLLPKSVYAFILPSRFRFSLRPSGALELLLFLYLSSSHFLCYLIGHFFLLFWISPHRIPVFTYTLCLCNPFVWLFTYFTCALVLSFSIKFSRSSMEVNKYTTCFF